MNKLLFRIAIITLLVAVISTVSIAGVIRGQIVDAVTANPVADANIRVEGGTAGAATNLDGRFLIEGVAPGVEYRLSVTHLNYQSASVSAKGDDFTLIELIPSGISRREVTVTSSRSLREAHPGAGSAIDAEAVKRTNTAVEPPLLAMRVPNATFFNWGGHTLGATHIRIRGFDSNRMTISVNGIPINDPEDHNVYWQDTPDFLSNTHDVQVERGVNSFLTAPSGIGGGINLSTSDVVSTRQTELGLVYGSYNTFRRTFLYRSGLVNERYNFTGRFSRASTDGYRDHSAVDEWSYFLAATRYDEESVHTLNVYGGKEVSDLSYYALQRSVLDTNRTWTPEAHHELDAIGGWDGERDDFQQPHIILRSKYRITDAMELEESLFWIEGTGFYEQYRGGAKLTEYGLKYLDTDGNGSIDTVATDNTDLIRRKHVDKEQFGWLPKLTWQMTPTTQVAAGLELRLYNSDHNNRVMWARNLPGGVPPQHSYNTWKMTKDYFGISGAITHKMNEKLQVNGGLEIRSISQKIEQDKIGIYTGYNVDSDWLFVNPRLGAEFQIDEVTMIYGSLAMSGREPWAAQILNADNPYDIPKQMKYNVPEVKAETMTDLEIGFRREQAIIGYGVNLYAMFFNNEISLTGVWNPLTEELDLTNAPTSRHLGVEIDGKWSTPVEGLVLNGDLGLDISTYGNLTFHYVDSISGSWEYIDETVSADGNPIAMTPNIVFNARANYERGDFTGELGLHAVGRQYLDPRGKESHSLEPYSLLNASLGYRILAGGYGWRLSLNVMNILDTEYEAFGWTETVDPFTVSPAGPPVRGAYKPMFVPAMGRSIMAGVSIEL